MTTDVVVRVRARAVHTDGRRRTVWLRIPASEWAGEVKALRAAARAHLVYLNGGPPEAWTVFRPESFCQCVSYVHDHVGGP